MNRHNLSNYAKDIDPDGAIAIRKWLIEAIEAKGGRTYEFGDGRSIVCGCVYICFQFEKRWYSVEVTGIMTIAEMEAAGLSPLTYGQTTRFPSQAENEQISCRTKVDVK
jgi:hypothetical protein